jgi:hypothetical protein
MKRWQPLWQWLGLWVLAVLALQVFFAGRIALMAAGLEACGVDVEEEPEGFIVHGTGVAPRGGALVEARRHRAGPRAGRRGARPR